jgi:hypothetical protein
MRKHSFARHLRPQRLEVRRDGLHVTDLQPASDAMHYGHVAHVVLKGTQLFNEILHMLPDESGIAARARVPGSSCRGRSMTGNARRNAFGNVAVLIDLSRSPDELGGFCNRFRPLADMWATA